MNVNSFLDDQGVVVMGIKFFYSVLMIIVVTFYQNCAPYHASNSSSQLASVTAFSLSCSPSDPRLPNENQLLPLNQFELENTLVDLFEPYLDSTQQSQFLSRIRPLINNIPKNKVNVGMDLANGDVTATHVERHFLLAEGVADYITSQSTTVNRMLGACSSNRTTEACQLSFIDNFGLRALRRVVDSDSRNYYLQVMRGHADSYRNVIVSMISSPFFYYHNQFGESATSTGLIELDAYERANKLSYFILQSMPDEELFRVAADGSLLNPSTFSSQVDRLLEHPKARSRLSRFFANQWLRLDNTANLRTDIREVQTRLSELNNPDPTVLRESLINEVYDYFEHLIWVERANYAKLMTSPLVFPRNQFMASIYGSTIWNGRSESENLIRAPASQRAGILTRAQFLYTGSGSTRPIMRGVHVYRDFMCQDLTVPADNATPENVVILDTMSDQERVRAITETQGSTCIGCHKNIINPIGFAFDNFDSFGQFRTTERVFHPEGAAQQGQVLTTKPVQSTISMSLDPFVNSEVKGAVDLSNKLAQNPNALACFSSKLWNFAQKANLEVEENPCAVKSVFESVNGTDGSILSAVKAITTQPEFTKRRAR